MLKHIKNLISKKVIHSKHVAFETEDKIFPTQMYIF